MSTSNDVDLIIYHRDCPDGFCAAFIAKKKYPKAELLGVTYGELIPTNKIVGLGLNVLLVDFSWKRPQMLELASLTNSIRVLDHHKTAQAELDGLDFAIFDMNRSGAGLAWDYLFGEDAEDLTYRDGSSFQERRPWYVDYVEDRDLWNWKLPDSKKISAYIMTLPHTVEAWKQLDYTTASDAVVLGAGALAHVQHYVEKITAQAKLGRLSGVSCFVVNAPYTNISEVCNELSKDGKIGVGWFERGDGRIQFSLRSQGDVDVSEIAKSFGGGGHKNAAGFELSVSEGRKLVDSVLGRNIQ